MRVHTCACAPQASWHQHVQAPGHRSCVFTTAAARASLAALAPELRAAGTLSSLTSRLHPLAESLRALQPHFVNGARPSAPFQPGSLALLSLSFGVLHFRSAGRVGLTLAQRVKPLLAKLASCVTAGVWFLRFTYMKAELEKDRSKLSPTRWVTPQTAATAGAALI